MTLTQFTTIFHVHVNHATIQLLSTTKILKSVSHAKVILHFGTAALKSAKTVQKKSLTLTKISKNARSAPKIIQCTTQKLDNANCVHSP